MSDSYFWDSNLWVYLFVQSENPDDIRKRARLIQILAEQEGKIHISAQVVNELSNVLLKKYKQEEDFVKRCIEGLKQIAFIHSLSTKTSLNALSLRKQYSLSWYDSLIVSAALQAQCTQLLSEDMHHELVIEGKLQIRNPFVG